MLLSGYNNRKSILKLKRALIFRRIIESIERRIGRKI